MATYTMDVRPATTCTIVFLCYLLCLSNGQPPPTRPPPDSISLIGQFSRPSNCSRELGEIAKYILQASEEYVQIMQLSPEAAVQLLPNLTFQDIGQECPPKPASCVRETECDVYQRFRTIDGYCNNMHHPYRGNAHTQYKRYLPPRYGDGVSSPRVSSTPGTLLPNPRRVTTTIHTTVARFRPGVSLWVMQWGQFLDHDMILTPTIQEDDLTTCCVDNDAQKHDACLPISVSANDEFYSEFGVTCLDFKRSEPTTGSSTWFADSQCHLGVRQQIDQNTAFIDASNVYGSSRADEHELRSFTDGLLRTQPNPGNANKMPYLPDDATGGCLSNDGESMPCFKAGDIRSTEQLGLTTTHTLWMREHNRIAKDLKIINPMWTDNTLFQESRKIVGALMQHITYNEFLPSVLGEQIMTEYDLYPLRDPTTFYNGYDASVDPSIANVFAGAAYRFGHSLVHDSIQRISPVTGQARPPVPLSSTMFRPQAPGNVNSTNGGGGSAGVDEICVGLSQRLVWPVDRHITTELRDKLFPGHQQPYGMDLPARNIQRGRDHGLPGYNHWRRWCGLPERSWEDLQRILPGNLAQLYRNLYGAVDDIDLFSIGIVEPPVTSDALVGETFACILANQFRELKRGDRFWYENGGMHHSFTQGQLRELKKASLSRVICDNTDDITSMQPRAMETPDPATDNPVLPCHMLASINLNRWRR